MMKKRLAATIMTLAIAGIMMTGCGISTSFTSTKTTTTTTTNADGSSVTTTKETSSQSSNGSHSSVTTTETTTTDADGNTSSVATTEDENGTVIRYEDAGLNVVNHLDFDVTQLYINFSDEDTWGENLMPEDTVFPTGFESGDEFTISYDSEHTAIDLAVVDEDGNLVPFMNVDISESSDPGNIKVNLEYDAEEDVYVAVVC